MRIEGSGWQTAYLRFVKFTDGNGICASYRSCDDVELLDVFEHKDFFRKAKSIGAGIFLSKGKRRGVFLLTVNKDLDYEIEFEYDDLEKWQISKEDGASGIPIGIR